MRRNSFFASAWVAAMACSIEANAQTAGSSDAYAYDALGRLVGQVSDGTVNDNNARTYCYDRAGNRSLIISDQSGVLSTPACPEPVYTSSNLWVGDVAATEGGALAFTVSRSGITSGAVSVSYVTSNGTAFTPGDYIAASGSINFAPGETLKTVNVGTVDDSLFESGETVTFSLSNASGAALADGVAIGTINDNDANLASYLSVADAEAVEGSLISFVVTRTGNTSNNSSIAYYTSTITALSNDYTPANATLSFAPGEVSKSISIATTQDTQAEQPERFYLTLQNPSVNTFVSRFQATGTIIDND